MTTVDQTSSGHPLLKSLAQPVVLLALMWVIRLADAILPGSWNRLFGVQSWRLGGLDGLILAPLLHASFWHLLSNTLPFLVLGLLIAFDGKARFWSVTGIVAVISGAGAWLINSPGTVTVGASGVVFGYFGYLLARAFVAPSLGHRVLYAVIGIVVGVVYGGGMISGILFASYGVSWQAHLFGAVGGVVAAYLLRPQQDRHSTPE
ncbi:MAG: rhomboid family intramembrane serine protease [Galactobacter sp.]